MDYFRSDAGTNLKADQPLTITDPLSNVTTFTYEVGDLIKVKDPLNRETQRILDARAKKMAG